MSQDSDGKPKYPRVVACGDQAITIEFGSTISEQINDSVYAFAGALSASGPSWLDELVPTYRSLLIQYNAFEYSFESVSSELKQLIDALAKDSETARSSQSRMVYELPVAYGGEYGPDLPAVADHAMLPETEVIQIHSGIPYRVYMIGFSPGFPYLGGMDPRIACPRLPTPRTRVAAGSVGIAESQTGVYPSASPGGWRIIGRTPVRLFDEQKNPPSVLQPGHFVRFVPVDAEEYVEIEFQVGQSEYAIKITELDR